MALNLVLAMAPAPSLGLKGAAISTRVANIVSSARYSQRFAVLGRQTIPSAGHPGRADRTAIRRGRAVLRERSASPAASLS